MLDIGMFGKEPVSGWRLPGMLENFLHTALEQAGHAVLCVDTSSGRILYANQWAIKLTGLNEGHHFSSLSPLGSPTGAPLGWLDQIILAGIREKYYHTCIVSDPPRDSRAMSKTMDVVATRVDDAGRDAVVVVIREVAKGRDIEHRLRKRNGELHVLNRASQMVSRSLNPDKVTTLALDVSLELLKGSAGKAFLVDWENSSLIKVSEKNSSQSADVLATDVQAHRMAVQAMRNRVPVLATNAGGVALAARSSASCTASIPLKSTGQVLGILQVTGGKSLFLDNDPALLDSLGFQVGIALENALLHQRVKQTADVDKLTGALARQRIEAALNNRIKLGDRYKEKFAVLMIDIDRFKSFNDVHGHEVGDQVLRNVAGLLLGEVRETDRVGRWGGEEFLVILPGADTTQAVLAAERIRMRIAAERIASDADVEIPVTVSIGVACYPEHSIYAEGMVRSADDAMLCAKRSGRNLTQVYSPNMRNACPLPPQNKVFQENGLGTINALAAALDAKDSYTANHSHDVKELAMRIAGKMSINRERIETLEMACVLHDIGKVSVPDSILNKPGPLDAKEWEIVKEHPRMGVMILREAPQLSPILPVVLHHHENFDGSGYPEGRVGSSIPVLARILAVADAYTAMKSSRPYRKAMDPNTAMREVKNRRGSHFDPRVIDTLEIVLEKEALLP